MEATMGTGSQVSRGRGRPKGSKNKLKTEKKVRTECDTPEVKGTLKIFRLLGTCSTEDCNNDISELDLEEGKNTIVTCTECGLRQKVSQLSKIEVKKKKHPRNVAAKKSEYLHNFHNEVDEEVDFDYDVDVPNELQGLSIQHFDADNFNSYDI